MDSISSSSPSHRPSPFSSTKIHRHHPRFMSNRRDGLKRVSSSLHQGSYHWGKGYSAGEGELNGDGEECMAPRFERARSFGTKDGIGRCRGAFFGRPFPSDTDRSDNPRNFTSIRFMQRDRQSLDRVDTSKQKSYGGEPEKGYPRKEQVTEDDCKKTSKLFPKNSPNMEMDDSKPKEAEKETVLKGRKEEKPPSVSPKRPEASPDQNNSSPKVWEEWRSCEQRPEKKGLQTPVTFFHVARRARSKRRREDPAKSQSSKGVSLDGFGAELEEALLKKLEAEVDSGVEQSVGMKNKAVDEGELALLRSSNIAVVQSDVCLLHKVEDAQAQKLFGFGGTSEREEGELDPEDDFAEVEHLKVDNGGGENAYVEMQVKSKVDDHKDKDNLGAGREGGDCQQMHMEARELESRLIKYEARSVFDGQELRNPDLKDKQRSFRDKEDHVDHGQEFSTGCEPDMKGASRDKEDHGDRFLQHKVTIPSASTEMEACESLHDGSASFLLHNRTSAAELHAKQWKPASSEKGFDPKKLTLSLFMQPAGAEAEMSKEKGHGMYRHRDLIDNFGMKQTKGVLLTQAENGVNDLASHAEELDELSVYNHKQKKLKIEFLQLCLALPGTTSASAGSCPPSLAGPVEHERSFQSQTQSLSHLQTETVSDGFTTSLSLSSFVHNPSCSLNCTSLENQELSCGGSRQLSQGFEHMSSRSWRNPGENDQVSNGFNNNSVTSLPKDRPKHKRAVSLYQRVLQNGNLQSHAGVPSGTASTRSSGSNQIPQRSEQIKQRTEVPRHGIVSSQNRQSMMGKEFPDRLQQLGCQAQSEPHVQLESLGDPLSSPAKRFGAESSKEMVAVRSLFSEQTALQKIALHEISSEPIAVMAQKLQELPDSFMEGLKDLVKELLGSFAKRDEFLSLQQTIRRRTDLTEEMLLRAHPTQLEILVALKTGMQVFVRQSSKALIYKALIEIFLQTRCRNVDCQQSLPVDGCECKVCSQKSGFCHECMCMVCSKFDSDNNTSRWVGCDICMHWCHTDCGLRMSHIKPTPLSQGGAESSQMQFECLSCGHHMELFGFVKGVFDNFAGAWGAETLAKELDCVRRIFHGSEDVRGKQLRWTAEKLLQKLEKNVDATEVCRSMLRFFHEANAELDGAGFDPLKQVNLRKPNEASDHVADATKEGLPKMGPIQKRKVSDLDKKEGAALQVFDTEMEVKRTEAADLQCERATKKAEIEDLDSIIQVKQAEAMLFRAHADAARQDANGLQHILSLKREKIEENFDCKYAKLRLDEAEERRKKQLEELQALQTSQYDYQKMKIRIELNIKYLMMKMGTAKPQLLA